MTPGSPLARCRRRLTTLVAVLATALGLTIAGVTAAGAADTLLSQGKTATASSQQGPDVAAGMAVAAPPGGAPRSST